MDARNGTRRAHGCYDVTGVRNDPNVVRQPRYQRP